MAYKDKKAAEKREGETPGTYRYNQRHHIGEAGSKFYLNKIRVRTGERIKRTESQIRLLERELEEISA